MAARLFLSLAALLLLPPPTARAAGVLSGEGSAQVIQEGGSTAPVEAVVTVVGSYAAGLNGDPFQAAVRLQFIRPDGKAVAYAVWTFPLAGAVAVHSLDDPAVGLLYYEVRPGTEGTRLFQAQSVAGELTVYGLPADSGATPSVRFKFLAEDPGSDGQFDTADDQLRSVFAGEVSFFSAGHGAAVSYGYQESQVVYAGGEMVLFYDDGCSGYPDDDGYYYDDSHDPGSYSGGDSCDGEPTSDYDDYDDDASCDYDDDTDTDDDWDDSGSSDSSDDSFWDWVGDDYEESGWELRSMSWLAAGIKAAGRALPAPRRLMRLFPLLAGLALLLLLRARTPSSPPPAVTPSEE